jgi:hypothetical protein
MATMASLVLPEDFPLGNQRYGKRQPLNAGDTLILMTALWHCGRTDFQLMHDRRAVERAMSIA